jgi:hypothetical protein
MKLPFFRTYFRDIDVEAADGAGKSASPNISLSVYWNRA